MSEKVRVSWTPDLQTFTLDDSAQTIPEAVADGCGRFACVVPRLLCPKTGQKVALIDHAGWRLEGRVMALEFAMDGNHVRVTIEPQSPEPGQKAQAMRGEWVVGDKVVPGPGPYRSLHTSTVLTPQWRPCE